MTLYGLVTITADVHLGKIQRALVGFADRNTTTASSGRLVSS